jgi:hypothetical protein
MRLRRKAAEYSNGARGLAISGGYALVVLGVAVFVVAAGGLAGIWLVIVTLPSAVLVQFVPAEGNLYVLCLTLGGLAQAWVLWLALRGKRLTGLRSG